MTAVQCAILGWGLFAITLWLLSAAAGLYMNTKDKLNEAEAEIEDLKK